MEGTPDRYHEDHIAAKGINSLSHYNAVHKFIPMPQALKISRCEGSSGQRLYPFLRGKIECSLVFFFELVYVFGKFPCLASGASLLSFSPFLRSVLKFHRGRTHADEEL